MDSHCQILRIVAISLWVFNRRRLKNFLAVLLASFSAFALSFALDLLLGGLVHAYPSTALLPVAWGVDTTSVSARSCYFRS